MFGKHSWTITHLLCACVYLHAQSLHGTFFFFCLFMFGKPGTCPHSLDLKCENDLTGQLVIASLRARCSVRPDKVKCWSWDQGKVYCRAMQGDTWLQPKNL